MLLGFLKSAMFWGGGGVRRAFKPGDSVNFLSKKKSVHLGWSTLSDNYGNEGISSRWALDYKNRPKLFPL